MALVKVLDLALLKKVGSRGQGTGVADFFYDKSKCVRLVMTRPPEVMTIPQKKQKGSIRLNKHKTIPLNPDNTFYYGVWPQEEAPSSLAKKLNRKNQTICYYRINGKTCYEHELDGKRYILVPGKDKVFNVDFIKWIYDPKLNMAYTEKALWNLDEADEKHLDYFWLQAFQATKKMQELEQKKVTLCNRLKKGMQKNNSVSQSAPER